MVSNVSSYLYPLNFNKCACLSSYGRGEEWNEVPLSVVVVGFRTVWFCVAVEM